MVMGAAPALWALGKGTGALAYLFCTLWPVYNTNPFCDSPPTDLRGGTTIYISIVSASLLAGKLESV